MGVTITQSASSASRTGSGQSHEIALMATKKSRRAYRQHQITFLKIVDIPTVRTYVHLDPNPNLNSNPIHSPRVPWP